MARFRLLVLAPLAMLAGCGERFAVDVKAPTATVMNQLASLDGSGTTFFGLSSFRKDVMDGGKVRYVIPARDGYDAGEVSFAVSDDDNGGSSIDVEVDLPKVMYGDKYLDEDLAALALRKIMQTWARDMADGTADTGEIEGVLTAMTIAAQDMGAFDGGLDSVAFDGLFGGEGAGAASDWGDGTMAVSQETTGDGDFGKPMSDPDRTTADRAAYDDGWGTPPN